MADPTIELLEQCRRIPVTAPETEAFHLWLLFHLDLIWVIRLFPWLRLVRVNKSMNEFLMFSAPFPDAIFPIPSL
uniref:Uncharacterized protein n=1 Tax=Picea glauca TaxID=3330 RepID=A0A124GP59_PICGL|nr:hypothetical protein ABT39_MTgene804 [Picea glauca]QHR90563.1 hypothetical protein Q903MT_gene4588 [Picea sitchensis]